MSALEGWRLEGNPEASSSEARQQEHCSQSEVSMKKKVQTYYHKLQHVLLDKFHTPVLNMDKDYWWTDLFYMVEDCTEYNVSAQSPSQLRRNQSIMVAPALWMVAG